MSKNAKIGIGVLALLVLLAILFTMDRKAEAPSGGTDTSDQSLREDAAAIDAELEGLEEDQAMIDQGLETDVSAE